MTTKILLLPGDGIGPEIMAEAVKVLDGLGELFGFSFEAQTGLLGGCAVDAQGVPLPQSTLRMAHEADAILLGSVGGPRWENSGRDKRPETGLLALRAELGLYANLRPAVLLPQLADASTLKTELVSGLDIMIIRELTGDLYFGQPRAIRIREDGQREAVNTMIYCEGEIERIGRVAFEIAMQRQRRVCSVDKANVLEVGELWRDVMNRIAGDYPEVALSHMYVDNAAMQLVRQPKQFDVMVSGNMFGDILSDCAAMLTGSIGMLPSASLDGAGKGMYEPVHGSAPDIAGQGKANPLAMILSLAMLLRYSLKQVRLADRVENAVQAVLAKGLRTPDIANEQADVVGTVEMGDAVLASLRESA